MSTAGLAQPLGFTASRPFATTRTAGVPWYIYMGVVAVSSASLGGNWDVSWHRSIGRDSFLTPAHIAIYACGVLAAVLCGYLIFATTFGKSASSSALREHSVSVLGFRAPLGAFLAAWGGIAMLTSAPFDNWWHAAYGLDVKIISPPHTLLILGIRCVGLGVVFLILAAMNREATSEGTAETPTYRSLQRLYLYLGGLMIGGNMFFLLEQTWDVKLHSASAYIAMGIALPLFFALIARSSRSPWACTAAAAIYTAIGIAEILIFPLFPRHPQTWPCLQPGDPPHSREVPHSHRRSRPRPGPSLAAHARMEDVADRHRLRRPLHRRPRSRGVAIRQLPPLESQRKPFLRHHLLRLQLPPRRL